MNDVIKNKIKQKYPILDDETLKYFSNYFYVLLKRDIIPEGVEVETLIDNALTFASKVVFYDETHEVYKKYGGDVKGYRDPETKTIYVRDNLSEPLREITVYHELHHAVQTNPKNYEVGINQESNIGRLIMEAQTQYFAEIVYEEVNNVNFEEREILSEDLRMSNNGIVISKLHNYEMYDNLISKLSIILDVDKDFFVSINYLYEDNKGLKKLEEKYNESYEKYNLPYKFNDLLLMIDYIYAVDLMAYIDSPIKKQILEGNETEQYYEIHPKQCYKLSLDRQRSKLNSFDVDCFLALLENGGNYKEFAKYVVDNEKRNLIQQFLGDYGSSDKKM